MKGFFTSTDIQRTRPETDLVPHCGACGLYKTCQSPKMKPYGDGRKGVLVLGEAPGGTEDEMGQPFIGKAGQELRKALHSIGVDLDKDAWTTNSLICRPPENATPTSKQLGYCRPNLVQTILDYSPRVVITLGRSALSSILQPYWGSVDALERWVGWQIPMASHWICPTYHPSYLLRMKNELMNKLFVDHLEAAFSIDDDPPALPDFARAIEVIYDPDAIRDALEAILERRGWASMDYETNCLKPDYPGSRIVSCAVSNGHRTISFPWAGEAIEHMQKFIRSDRVKKIAANLKFEEQWTLHEFGFGVTGWEWDTMLATHCLDNRQGICSLKFQALVRMGVPVYNQHIEPFLFSKGRFNRIQEIPIRDLLFYGGMDALLEYWLAKIQRKEMGHGKD